MVTALENNVLEAPALNISNIGNRFTYEQLAPQLEGLGIKKEHLSPADLHELLNARRTSPLMMNQADQYGTITPVQGRLFVYDHIGEGPKVEMIPKALELSPAPRYLGYQLSQEDHIRLMKTGEMGKAVPLIDKQDGKQFMGMIGIDASTNRMSVMRVERFVTPTVLRGVPITPKQQETLKNHGVIRVKNMNGIDGKPFTADVQFSVNDRKLKFKPVNQAALDTRQEQRATQANGPRLDGAPLFKPTPKEAARILADDTWKNTVVNTKNPAGERVRKIAGNLTYGDQIRVTRPKDGEQVYRPLNNVYPGLELRSPRAQAKQEIMDYRSEQLGKPLPLKTPATEQQIQKATQKFSVINSSLEARPAVEKPATQTQTGAKESAGSAPKTVERKAAPGASMNTSKPENKPENRPQTKIDRQSPEPARKGPRR